MIVQTQIQQVRNEANENTDLTQVIEKFRESCSNCHPITPLECITECNVWKLKNEFRNLSGIMNQQDYFDKLLNALKNRRRLQLLKLLSESSLLLSEIQNRFRNLSYRHSQGTIMNEYLSPLMAVGLVINNTNRYQATILGKRILTLFQEFFEEASILPPHSECYEEKIINVLSASPKTYEELKLLISTKSLGRVLKRLQEASILAKDEEAKYMFYFRSRRNPKMERVSSTEKRVYDSIPTAGIDAETLSEKAQITLRRTYKYLRKLRGKKLVFKRKLPKKYSLTENGIHLATLFEKLRSTLLNFSKASAQLNTENSDLTPKLMTPDIQLKASVKDKRKQV
jgi:predicted transcriptional regulator